VIVADYGQVANKTDSVIAWLMEGDPAIRWQVRRDVLGQASSQVARERAGVAHEGWGSQLLNLQTATGVWAGLYTPKWTSATYTLLLLKALGLPAGNRAAGLGATILLDKGLYHDSGINFWTPRRRCSETCVTGMILGIASRFVRGDDRLDRLAEHLLSEQMSDGGWNCRRHLGATHSSLHTTISALEGILEYEEAGGRLTRRTQQARQRAHDFLYAHQMYCSHRTGRVIDDRMMRFSFPPQWHYDVLRGLDYLAAAKTPREERIKDAIELLMKRRTSDGRWLLQNVYRGHYHFVMENSGQPSRWNTLRALRVLRWWQSES
jgi:hypothetical protein